LKIEGADGNEEKLVKRHYKSQMILGQLVNVGEAEAGGTTQIIVFHSPNKTGTISWEYWHSVAAQSLSSSA
jgi:hypothetical protein